MGFGFYFRRLSFRIAFFCFLILIIPAGVALYYFAERLNADFRDTMLHQLAGNLELKAEKSLNLLDIAKADMEAGSRAFQDAVNRGGPRAELVRVMTGLLMKSGGYFSVKFIDAGGVEVARVDRAGTDAREASPETRHDESRQKYFNELMRGGASAVGISSVEPVAANDGASPPVAGVIHAGKVIMRHGQAAGLLAVSIRAGHIFGPAGGGKEGGFLVFSERGNYLHHWDGSALFGEELNRGANILKELPVLKENIGKQDSLIWYDPSLREFRIWKKVFHDRNDKSRFWVFMERRPEHSIIPSWLVIVRKGMVAFSFIILSGFAVVALFIHKSLDPLEKLVSALKRTERGERGVRVAFRTNTELDEIANAFNAMAEKLKDSDAELRFLMEMERSISAIAPNAHIIIDAGGGIISVNPFTEKIFGYSAQELVGRNVSVLVPPPHRERHDGYLRNYVTSGVAKVIGKTLEVEAVRKDGATFPIKLYVGEAKVGDHRVFIGIIEDITELKKTMAKLVRSNREIVSFANIVSHDLRSPLVNLKGFSYELREVCNEIEAILLESSSFPERQRKRLIELLHGEVPEALGYINSSTSAMERLISNILKLARIGTRQLHLSEVDVNRLVGEKLRTMKHQIESQSITVQVGDLPAVRADESAVDQIFSNILTNAVNYMSHDRLGKIEISGRRRESDTLYSVKDNGRGIAEEDRHKVFELFRRAGKQDVPGEGMGLSYVKTLVERHEGEIWFDSRLDGGTTFHFTIANNIQEAKEEAIDGKPQNG